MTDKIPQPVLDKRVEDYSAVSLATLDLIEQFAKDGIEARIILVALLHLSADGLAHQLSETPGAFDLTIDMAANDARKKHGLPLVV